ncbi:MAG TPA: MMPL family transporter [Haliangiales bacterium]|nr:MMPL family transporter [Haliangiales bacterium]
MAVCFLIRGGRLTSGRIDGIESDRGQVLLERALGRPGSSSFIIVFEGAEPAAMRERVHDALAPLRADARVARVVAVDDVPTTFVFSTLRQLGRGKAIPNPFLSSDGTRAVAIVTLAGDFRTAIKAYPDLIAKVAGLPATFTGHLAFMHDLDVTLEKDLLRAEAISLPLSILVLLLVFSTLAAATVPVFVGALAVVGGVAVVNALSHLLDLAQYTINVVTLIGLGVAIDYSLFLVSRYRDELARGRTVPDAIARAVATSGRAVAFSGFAVIIGLSGLFFFRGSYLMGMGLGGAIVVFLAVVYALTFLPALLGVLGPRIDAGRVPFRLPAGEGIWHRLATAVMRRPLLVLLPTLALVVLVGAPFLRLRLAASDVRALPGDTGARRGHELLRAHFPDLAATRIDVVARFPGPLTPARVGALADLSRRLAALPGVTRVESPLELDPNLRPEDYLTRPPDELPAPVAFFVRQSVRDGVVLLSALAAGAPESVEARAIVRAVRADRRAGDAEILVTGQTANDVDSTEFILDRTPAAVAFVVAATLVVLFLLLGSVLLPLKAVAMNFLSIAASFGALVWIFQEGHLRGLLGVEPAPIEPTLPLLLFCALFGLSMDYEVLLLSRMHEEYLATGDNTGAVAEGLERSGRLITSAAAIMVTVFAAFALARVVLIKAMGLGMAIAVTLDATLVRVLIVPSTMRLLGDLNWWAPGPLKRLCERLGLHAPR